MNKLTLILGNCWGIGELSHTFDFRDRSVYAIYAPNGSMKSSLAKTFLDIANGVSPSDHFFPARASTCGVLDENKQIIPRENIVVLSPYEPPLEDADAVASLLVNSKLREQYERLHADTEKAKTALIKELKKQAKCKNVEQELSLSFTFTTDNFIAALGYPYKDLHENGDAPYADLPYDTVFDEKVVEVLKEPDIKAALDSYIARYNELIGKSTYFRKGTFEYYQASTIAKNLEQQGFFKAKHSVVLNGAEKPEPITSKAQLESVIAAEKEKITSDPDLRTKFAKVEDNLLKNQVLKDFRTYILNNEAVLAKMANINNFKQEVWKSYLRVNLALYDDLLAKSDTAKTESKVILEEARKENPRWEGVIATFNDRFGQKVKLGVKDREAVVVGSVLPSLTYSVVDRGEEIPVERKDLLDNLCQGEKKALYILDILFDVEVRKSQASETIFIVDDIADSFDYKNKYAIIQYLMDISRNPPFKMILLTHNFDFYRTICGRFVGHDGCLMATRDDNGVITIDKPEGIKNVFINVWKKCFFNDARRRLASIAFMRNLIEYTKSSDDNDYKTLTGLLHQKRNTHHINQRDLDGIYARLFGPTAEAWAQPDELVIDSLFNEANRCLAIPSGVRFENKVVLSVAIRLAAEKFMFGKLNDPALSFDEAQTSRLFECYKKAFPANSNEIRVIDSVLLMTPENIHLNAFMYEPIVDMADDHLKKLYKDVTALV